jgi:hypothetical protein
MKKLLFLSILFCSRVSAIQLSPEEISPTYQNSNFLAKKLHINDLHIAQDLQSKNIPSNPDERKAKIEEYYHKFLIDKGRATPSSFTDQLRVVEKLSLSSTTKQVFLLVSLCYAGLSVGASYFFDLPLPLSIVVGSTLETTSVASLSYEGFVRFFKRRAHKNEIEKEIQTLYQKDVTYYKYIKPKLEYGYQMFASFKQEKCFTDRFPQLLKTPPLKKIPTDIIILIN